MRKITTLILAAACILTAAAATPKLNVAGKTLKTTPVAKKELERTASIQGQTMTQKTLGTPSSRKAIGARKADASTSIEGTWTFTMGDWYNGEDSQGSIEIDFNATLDEDGLWFEDPDNYELPFVADYDSSTGTLTFTTVILGNTGTYNIVQRPFVYTNNINFTNITATYNASAGTITFDADNGIAWAAWSSNNASSQAGYFSIYDLEEAEKAVPWTLMEDATFNENLIYGTFKGVENTQITPVEVYENPFTPGIYRVINPFGVLYKESNFNSVSPTMVIDATNPDNVLVEMQSTGISGGATVGVYYYFNEGWYAEEFGEELDPELICTLTKDSDGYTVITFPYHSITLYAATSGGFYYGAAYPSVLKFKAPKDEPAAPSLSLGDVEMEVEINSTEAVTTTVDVALTADPAFQYQGFQFDVTLPEGVEVESVSSTLTVPEQIFVSRQEDGNVFRVLAYMDEATESTGTIATLTLSTTWSSTAAYPVEDTIIITDAIFSTPGGKDIEDIEGAEASITINEKEIPATSIKIDNVELLEPSFTSETGNVSQITAGEGISMEVSLTPDPTTDTVEDIKWSVSPENDNFVFEINPEGILTVTTEGVEVATETTFTITGTITHEGSAPVTGTYELTINPVILGDSNDTGDNITVADVVTTANYFNKKDVARFDFPNANVVTTPVNGIQAINQSDITATVDLVLGRTSDAGNAQSIKRMAGVFNNNDLLVADDFNVVYGEQTTIGICLDNSVDYVGLHAEVILPEGMKAVAVTKGERAAAHELDYNIKDGKVYVTLYSMRNAGFAQSEGALFNLVVVAEESCGDLRFENINASDAGYNSYYFGFDGGKNLTGTTGIIGIDADKDARYFDINGLEVKNPEKGIFIRINANGEAVKVVK